MVLFTYLLSVTRGFFLSSVYIWFADFKQRNAGVALPR